MGTRAKKMDNIVKAMVLITNIGKLSRGGSKDRILEGCNKERKSDRIEYYI